MNRIIEGVVHGRTIELLEDPGVSDGQRVQVLLAAPTAEANWGEGIRRTAGALADDPYWDAIMADIHEGRKRERRPQGDQP